MINIKTNQQQFNSDIQKLFDTVESTASQKNIKSITRAATAIAAKSFIKDVNSIARSNVKSFHHLYEWGTRSNPLSGTGVDNKRLFTLKRDGNGEFGKISLEIKFIQSKMPVPVPQSLSAPGKTGKTVVRKSIFRDKASVMESGRGTSWKARRNIVFRSSSGEIIFRRRGTPINISNIGGNATTKALENFSEKWQSTTARAVLENSNLIPSLEQGIVQVLNGNKPTKTMINKKIETICVRYGSEEREF